MAIILQLSMLQEKMVNRVYSTPLELAITTITLQPRKVQEWRVYRVNSISSELALDGYNLVN